MNHNTNTISFCTHIQILQSHIVQNTVEESRSSLVPVNDHIVIDMNLTYFLSHVSVTEHTQPVYEEQIVSKTILYPNKGLHKLVKDSILY